MIIGITGSFGSGKGETVRGIVARGCRYLEKISYNLNSDGTSPVPAALLRNLITI